MASGFQGTSSISHIRLPVFAYYDWETDGEFIADLRDKQPPRNTKRPGINGVPCLVPAVTVSTLKTSVFANYFCISEHVEAGLRNEELPLCGALCLAFSSSLLFKYPVG